MEAPGQALEAYEDRQEPAPRGAPNFPMQLAAQETDAAPLRERFAFPASIGVDDNGSTKDCLNWAAISQECPQT